MLTAGKLYTALAGLVYLALATRALGAHNFGVLILIHAYAVAIRDFITLKTAQCVVRYGALCLENNAREDFQKLVKFTTLLDIVFCVIGTLVGILALSRVGPWFGVTEDLELVAAVYCCMILFNFKTTSLGLLRLFNRFDLVALMLMVVPDDPPRRRLYRLLLLPAYQRIPPVLVSRRRRAVSGHRLVRLA